VRPVSGVLADKGGSIGTEAVGRSALRLSSKQDAESWPSY
jgi:hypothetical protein